MSRRSRIGLGLAIPFTLGNIAGGIYAGAMGEMNHAGLHAMLTVVGAFIIWVIASKGRASAASRDLAAAGVPRELSSRLRSLEQSLDAMAVEVERIGEGQRFMTRLFTERGERDREAI